MGDRFYSQQSPKRYYGRQQLVRRDRKLTRIDGIEDVMDALTAYTNAESNVLFEQVTKGVALELKRVMLRLIPEKSGNLKRSLGIKKRTRRPGEPTYDLVFRSGKGGKANGFYWRFVDKDTDAHSLGQKWGAAGWGRKGSKVTNRGAWHRGTNGIRFVEQTALWYAANKEQIYERQWKRKMNAKIRKELNSKQKRI